MHVKTAILLSSLIFATIISRANTSNPVFSCQELQNSTLGYSFDILHCPTSHLSPSGYFMVITDYLDSLQLMKITGRVVGPLISELLFERTEDSGKPSKVAWKASYILQHTGRYSVNIEIRYIHFDPNNYEHAVAHGINNEILTDYAFEVHMTAEQMHKFSKGRTMLGECSIRDLDGGGVWRSLLPHHQLRPKWFQANGTTVTLFESDYAILNSLADHLVYEPHLCNLKKSLGNTSSCRYEENVREICLVGDSQIRHLALVLYGLFEGLDASFFHAKTLKTDKFVYGNERIHDFDDVWAKMDFLPSQYDLLSNCSTIIVSFGQWHVSHARGGLYTPSDYASLTNRTLTKYRSLYPTHKILFIGTMPFGVFHLIYATVEDTEMMFDYRNDVVLRALNVAAMDTCRALGSFGCLNLFEVGNALRDLSYDTCHFKAPVINQLGLAVVTTLCNDGTL